MLSLPALIAKSESMEREEREYWLTLLPSMNQEQTERFHAIMQMEHDKLEELKAKYGELPSDHLQEAERIIQELTA